ncbi:hypothetical protein FHR48_002402 [Xanthomonas arboricola]|nr:hypothetical protein [Xanthomonas cannabis]NIK64850.1 hypothetical protein [Xanthomonas cannabis]
MYLRRVLRWWAGKGPATKLQLTRFKSGITPRNGSNQFPVPRSQFPIPDSQFPPCTQRIPWQIELRHD